MIKTKMNSYYQATTIFCQTLSEIIAAFNRDLPQRAGISSLLSLQSLSPSQTQVFLMQSLFLHLNSSSVHRDAFDGQPK